MTRTSTTTPHRITAPHVPLIVKWFAERGGIAVWHSINIANLGATWTTAATTATGQPPRPPTWQVGSTPDRIITDPAEVVVDIVREVQRVPLAVHVAAHGEALKLTDESERTLRGLLEAAGPGAYYDIDARTHDVVLYVPDASIPLPDYPLN